MVLTSCVDRGTLTEKQVIEMTYTKLMDRAERLQGSNAAIAQGEISWAFNRAVLDAMSEAISSGDLFGESVQVRFPQKYMPEYSIATWTGALKKCVKYKGGGIWSVSISGDEWQFIERTGEVTARNEQAAKLLEEITLKTYHNSRYGYYVDYPPSWTINEVDKSGVGLFSDSLEAFVLIGVIEEEELAAYKGLQGYIEGRLSYFQSQYHAFELTEVSTMRVDYTYMLREDAARYEAKHYFLQHGSRVYEIVCSAIQPRFESLSTLYDAYSSFRFQP